MLGLILLGRSAAARRPTTWSASQSRRRAEGRGRQRAVGDVQRAVWVRVRAVGRGEERSSLPHDAEADASRRGAVGQAERTQCGR